MWTGSAFVVPSAMAKAAVHAMTMSLAVEWGGYGIRLNAIAAGPIPTDYAWEMLNPTSKSAVGATQADQVPMQRFGTVEELANLNIFLLSDACHYLTGHTIAMDGGQHLAGPGTFAGLTSLSDEDWAEIQRAEPGRSRGGQGAAHDDLERYRERLADGGADVVGVAACRRRGAGGRAARSGCTSGSVASWKVCAGGGGRSPGRRRSARGRRGVRR